MSNLDLQSRNSVVRKSKLSRPESSNRICWAPPKVPGQTGFDFDSLPDENGSPGSDKTVPEERRAE